jgi:hypothetical protein
VTTIKQRLANQRNALKSSGPRSLQGKTIASKNATKHSLSLPIDEHFFAEEINAILALTLQESVGSEQAVALAKRIIDYERNEAYLYALINKKYELTVENFASDTYTISLRKLLVAHQRKLPVGDTFTTTNKKPKGKERTDEIKFIERFLRIMSKAQIARARNQQEKKGSGLRYQKRATSQLIKGIHTVAHSVNL